MTFGILKVSKMTHSITPLIITLNIMTLIMIILNIMILCIMHPI
jgi:hypothetical protein